MLLPLKPFINAAIGIPFLLPSPDLVAVLFFGLAIGAVVGSIVYLIMSIMEHETRIAGVSFWQAKLERELAKLRAEIRETQKFNEDYEIHNG